MVCPAEFPTQTMADTPAKKDSPPSNGPNPSHRKASPKESAVRSPASTFTRKSLGGQYAGIFCRAERLKTLDKTDGGGGGHCKLQTSGIESLSFARLPRSSSRKICSSIKHKKRRKRTERGQKPARKTTKKKTGGKRIGGGMAGCARCSALPA